MGLRFEEETSRKPWACLSKVDFNSRTRKQSERPTPKHVLWQTAPLRAGRSSGPPCTRTHLLGGAVGGALSFFCESGLFAKEAYGSRATSSLFFRGCATKLGDLPWFSSQEETAYVSGATLCGFVLEPVKWTDPSWIRSASPILHSLETGRTTAVLCLPERVCDLAQSFLPTTPHLHIINGRGLDDVRQKKANQTSLQPRPASKGLLTIHNTSWYISSSTHPWLQGIWPSNP